MTVRLGMAQINVDDLDLAWKFYTETLGLPGRRTLGPNRAFELLVSDQVTVLVYPVANRSTELRYPDSTGNVLVFYTDDIRATVSDWSSRNVSFLPISWSTDPAGIAPTPFGNFIAFQDPFGNVHELLEPR